MADTYYTPPLLTQGAGANVPSLQSQMQGESYLPQAGELPPVSCPVCIPAAGETPSLFWLAVVAAGLVALTARKRKPKGSDQTNYGFS